MLSVKAGLFLLKNACVIEDNVEVLEKEGQIDFIICLPWFINEEFKEDAVTVVDLLSRKKKLDPPKLVNIAKARLATICNIFIDEILQTKSLEEIYSNLHQDVHF